MRATIVRAAADEVSSESSRAAAASGGRDDCANVDVDVDAMIGRGGGPVDFDVAATLPSHHPQKRNLAWRHPPLILPPSYLSSAAAPRRVLLKRGVAREEVWYDAMRWPWPRMNPRLSPSSSSLSSMIVGNLCLH